MAVWFGLFFPVTSPIYFAKLSESAELTAPADRGATAGAFHKKVGGACCACFRCSQFVTFCDFQMRHCHAKYPGLNLRKEADKNIYFFKEENVPHMKKKTLFNPTVGKFKIWPRTD